MRHGKHSEPATPPPLNPSRPEKLKEVVRGRERQVFGLLAFVAVVIAAFTILSTTLGDGAPRETPTTPPATESGPPEVALVVCTENGARPETEQVVARPDGVHLRIRSKINGVYSIRSSEEPDLRIDGRIRKRQPAMVATAIPPGETLVGCFPRPNAVPEEPDGDAYATLMVEDPQSLWTPPTLACDDASDAGVFTGPRVDPNQPAAYEALAVQTVPGIRPDDRLAHPGYPETRWPFTRMLVVRDGDAIATLVFIPGGRRWSVDTEACPEAGIGEG